MKSRPRHLFWGNIIGVVFSDKGKMQLFSPIMFFELSDGSY